MPEERFDTGHGKYQTYNSVTEFVSIFLCWQKQKNFGQKVTAKQCFGSGSMWIRIEMATLDPDPFWQSGSRSRTVKMVSKKEKNLRFQVKKSFDHFAEGLTGFT